MSSLRTPRNHSAAAGVDVASGSTRLDRARRARPRDGRRCRARGQDHGLARLEPSSACGRPPVERGDLRPRRRPGVQSERRDPHDRRRAWAAHLPRPAHEARWSLPGPRELPGRRRVDARSPRGPPLAAPHIRRGSRRGPAHRRARRARRRSRTRRPDRGRPRGTAGSTSSTCAHARRGRSGAAW